MRLSLDQIAAHWFVRPGSIVFDIGTFHGETAALYLARGAAVVHGFEPQAAARRALPAGLLGDTRFRLWPFALGECSGTVELHVPERNAGGATLHPRFFEASQGTAIGKTPQELVEVRRLDELELPTAQFWKIDAEGSELEILKGAANLLATAPPAAIQVEIFLYDRDRYVETLNFINDQIRYFWGVGFTASGKLVVYEVNSQTASSQHFHDDLARTGTPRYFASNRPLREWMVPPAAG